MMTKKLGVVVGVLVCVAMLAAPAMMQASVPGTRSGETSGTDPVLPAAPIGYVGPIEEPTLPTVTALAYARDLRDAVEALDIGEFESPDYYYTMRNLLTKAGDKIQFNKLAEGLEILANDVAPNVEKWVEANYEAEVLDNVETLAAMTMLLMTPTVVTPNHLDAGGLSGYKTWMTEQHYEIVRNDDAWNDAFWDSHAGIYTPMPAAPTVDFDTETVIMAFLGEQTTNGWSIEIVGVDTYGDCTVVTVQRDGPTTQNTNPVMTNPFDIVSIPYIERGQPVLIVDTYSSNVIEILEY